MSYVPNKLCCGHYAACKEGRASYVLDKNVRVIKRGNHDLTRAEFSSQRQRCTHFKTNRVKTFREVTPGK